MSQRDLEAVIGRAVIDKEFRNRLYADSNATLEAYELSESELAALRSVDVESLEACGDTPGIVRLRRLARASAFES